MFRHHERHDRFFAKSVISSKVMDEFLSQLTHTGEGWKRLKGLPLFQYERLSFGITQALTTGKDVAYEAVMKAVKASVAYAVELI